MKEITKSQLTITSGYWRSKALKESILLDSKGHATNQSGKGEIRYGQQTCGLRFMFRAKNE